MVSLFFRSQIIRYAMVGLANTAVTAVIIFTLMHFNVGLYAANISGYLAGIIFSFLANSIFTFSTPMAVNRFAKFLFACLVCWTFNLLAIKIFLSVFPHKEYASQLVGMFIYTSTGFIINKLWVMK
ncbi:Putative flippase GtrA (transmembrane translocase of bactoprenol-linked glucose) [Pantoea agglomerans]|nr:Putative flippase GtrA (transmembrane translocase of bactoprenol-linked glucose) [Pantoea agglomerans]